MIAGSGKRGAALLESACEKPDAKLLFEADASRNEIRARALVGRFKPTGEGAWEYSPEPAIPESTILAKFRETLDERLGG